MRRHHGRVACGQSIPAGDQSIGRIPHHAMDNQAAAMIPQDQLTGFNLGGDGMANCENIARPNRWQHTGAKNPQPHPPGNPKGFSNKIAPERMLELEGNPVFGPLNHDYFRDAAYTKRILK